LRAQVLMSDEVVCQGSATDIDGPRVLDRAPRSLPQLSPRERDQI
jgi:hypothetical protein